MYSYMDSSIISTVTVVQSTQNINMVQITCLLKFYKCSNEYSDAIRVMEWSSAEFQPQGRSSSWGCWFGRGGGGGVLLWRMRGG